MRATNKPASRRRRKKLLERAKGFWGMRGNTLRQAKDHVAKALQYSYRDRRTKKREFRRLWIARINAAARLNGTTYSKLIAALRKKQVEINRKMLADLAVNNPDAFSDVVKFAFS